MKVVPPTTRTLASLRASTSQLHSPPDYERGWPADTPILPEEVLAFAGHSTRHLRLQPQVQHHRFVLLLALQGRGDLRLDQQIHHLQPGEVLLLFPFQMHDYLFFPKPEVDWLFLTFTTRTPEELEPLRNSIYSLTPEMIRLLRHFLAEVIPVPPAPAAALKAQLHLALLLKELLLGQSFSLPSKISGSATAVKLLEKVNRFIYAHIEKPFGVADLAQHIGYSESHLRSLFRRSVRMSLGNYIATLRLRKATGLLHAGELGISKISEACGYRSIYAFSRAFRRAYDCSPTEFRKKYQTTAPKSRLRRKSPPASRPPSRD